LTIASTLLGNAGECAFLQGTASGVSGTQIYALIQQLQGHNCKDCGSVPIGFPQSNDPSSGILTVNFVADIGACESDDGVCDASRPQASPPSDPPQPSQPSQPSQTSQTPQPKQSAQVDKFEWAVVGDSWSSGVAYSTSTMYDSNTDFCFRTNEAWGAQMEADATWTQNQQDFHFAACGGDKFANLKTRQIPNTGSPQLIISTIGGNNAFFGSTVDACVYQGNPKAYGNPYDQDPDGTGLCKKGLQATLDYINNANSGLSFDLKQTLNDLFATDQARSHPEFYLYLASYVYFFNATTDACDDWSFAPWWRIWKPKLVKALRQEFNDKLDAFHTVYVSVLARILKLSLI
jgi:hypothetical protein